MITICNNIDDQGKGQKREKKVLSNNSTRSTYLAGFRVCLSKGEDVGEEIGWRKFSRERETGASSDAPPSV